MKENRKQHGSQDGESIRELEAENCRLKAELERCRQTEILQTALYQISEKTSQIEDINALYAALHNIISGLFYARNLFIALLDPSEEIIHFPYYADEFDAQPPPQKLGRGCTEHVIRTGQPLLVSNRQIEQMVADGVIEMIGAAAGEWMGVPLKWGEHTFGVLVVQSYQEDFHYSERDRELLIFVSQHIANALWRKKTEAELLVSERKYRMLFEESQDVIFIADGLGNLADMNPAGVKLFGFASLADLLKEKKSLDTYTDLRSKENIADLISKAGHIKDYEIILKKKDGKPVTVTVTAQMERDSDGRAVAVRGSMRDITERKLLEERFIQAQKMESIGLLAGGIAHDFNNILSGILGYASWLKANLQENHPFFKAIATIEQSATRAAELTSQLLAFARGGRYDARPACLNDVIGEALKIIRSTFDRSIVIETRLGDNLPTVEIDVGQIQQVIMNLCVNARDAMPGGGRLIIQSSVIWLSENDASRQPEIKPGGFAVLSVSDTGVGMNDAVKQRIFEPFFTTKEKGTGLGLAMVYGVVKNHGGFINVYSEVGEGTTFRIYLPLSGKPEVKEPTSETELTSGNEMILVVDDEPTVREVTADILESYGYRVLLAADGEAGASIFRERAPQIDMVILDMIMPRQGGRETFLELC